MRINEIRIFIPSKDYEASKSFYRSLGFVGEDAGGDMTIFEKDGCVFFLQNKFYSEEAAKSLMLQLIVPDINEAYKLVSELSHYGIKFSDISTERWGKVLYLWGPSGELWHVTELNS